MNTRFAYFHLSMGALPSKNTGSYFSLKASFTKSTVACAKKSKLVHHQRIINASSTHHQTRSDQNRPGQGRLQSRGPNSRTCVLVFTGAPPSVRLHNKSNQKSSKCQNFFLSPTVYFRVIEHL